MSCTIQQDFCIPRGDDLRVVVHLTDQAGEEVDIQDVQNLRWWVARSPSQPPVIQKNLSDGSMFLGGPSTFFFDLVPADTESLPPGGYYHETEIITAQGLVHTVMAGRLRIERDLIRD